MLYKLIKLVSECDCPKGVSCHECPHFSIETGCDPNEVMAQYLIDNGVTIQNEVGHWVNVQNGKGICSNCNRLDSIDILAKYCRYCGAKIVGLDVS